MRLVGVAVPDGGRGPVNLALPVKVADQSLYPLHSGEALRSQPDLRGEPPAQGPRKQSEITGYLTDRNSPGQRVMCKAAGQHGM